MFILGSLSGWRICRQQIFYIEDSGQKKFNPENYLKIRSVRLFEGQYDDMEQDPVTSLIGFDADQTRYVFAELTFSNQLMSQAWNCEIFVRYFNESGDIKSTVSKLRPIKKGSKLFQLFMVLDPILKAAGCPVNTELKLYL